MEVALKPSAIDPVAGTAMLDVQLAIPAMSVAPGAPLFTHQNMAPRMRAPLRIETLTVSDDRGTVPLTDDGKNGLRSWSARRTVTGTVRVRYRTPIDNAAGGGLSTVPVVDGPGLFGVGNMLLLLPKSDARYRIAIRWDLSALPAGSTAVSTFGDGDQLLAAGPLSRLTFAMFMAGKIQRAPDPRVGHFSAVWTGNPQFDIRAAAGWSGKLYSWMSRFFGDPSEPLYHVFLRENPVGNGVAAPHAFVQGYGPHSTAEGMQTILGHEMTHTWTATSIGKWYNEGNAVFYQARLPWRAGMIPTEKYLADINLTAARYYTNDMIRAPDSTVEPNFWTDMRYNVLSYDRGAMYFAVLDGRIRRASKGKRSVDDLVRAMVDRIRRELPITEATWTTLLRTELGDSGPRLHRKMMAGAVMLPETGDFGPCFRRVRTKIGRYDLGFGGPEITRRSVVEGLRADSAAARAGLKEGDKIEYATSTEGAQRNPATPLVMKVTRGAQTLEISYIPRGKPVDAYQWVRVAGIPDERCRPT